MDFPSLAAGRFMGLDDAFGADQAIMVLFGDPTAFDDIKAGRFFRVVLSQGCVGLLITGQPEIVPASGLGWLGRQQ
mgnify:CR=1 FL=1